MGQFYIGADETTLKAPGGVDMVAGHEGGSCPRAQTPQTPTAPGYLPQTSFPQGKGFPTSSQPSFAPYANAQESLHWELGEARDPAS